MSDRPMRQPFLVGDRIYLRQLEAADVEGPYLAWVNDYEVTRFLETGRSRPSRHHQEMSVLHWRHVSSLALPESHQLRCVSRRCTPSCVG